MTQNFPEVIKFVKEIMSENDTSHNWEHIERVHRISCWLAKQEDINDINYQRIIELASILHDVVDHKYVSDENAMKIEENIRNLLQSVHINDEGIEGVFYIIKNLSYSHELNGSCYQQCGMKDERLQKCFDIVQDADRLDALGAIGIARCLTFGLSHNRILYDPNIKPLKNFSKEEYQDKNRHQTTLNHFEEKLLRLKTLMKTKAGRKLAEKRTIIMQHFVDQFVKEWHLNDQFMNQNDDISSFL